MPSLRISTKLPGCGRSGHRAAGCDGAQEDGAQVDGRGRTGPRADRAWEDGRGWTGHRWTGHGRTGHRWTGAGCTGAWGAFRTGRRPSVHAASAGAERLLSPTHTSLRPMLESRRSSLNINFFFARAY